MSATAEAKAPEAKPYAKFKHRIRLVHGSHIDGQGEGYAGPGTTGAERRFHWKEGTELGKQVDPNHPRQCVFDTDTDLVKKFNKGGSVKFEYVTQGGTQAAEYVPPGPGSVDLNKLSLLQLQAVAQDEGIDLRGASKKEEVVARIQAVLQPPQPAA